MRFGLGLKREILLVVPFIFLLACGTVSAATWAGIYGSGGYEQANAVQQTSDGGFIIAGETFSFGAGSDDSWLLKIDGESNIQWQKTYGGSNFDLAKAVGQTQDGGYIVAGVTGSFGAGSGDFWLLRLDANGYILWQKTYGGAGYEEATSAGQTSDGGYIVTGNALSFGAGNEDVWVLKLDADGNIVWQKIFGGILADAANSVLQTSDGGYIVSGVTWSFGAGSGDALVFKLDSAGDIRWQRVLGGSGYDEARAVAQTVDGGFIVAGMTGSFGEGDSDWWIFKLDSSGNVQWQRTYGGALEDWANSVEQTSDGGYIVAGLTFSFGVGNGDFWVLKLDSAGNIQWQRTYGSGDFDEANSIRQISDGYIVAGRTWASGKGFYDALVLKLDPDGELPACSAGFMKVSVAAFSFSNATVTIPVSAVSDTGVTPQSSAALLQTTDVTPGGACETVEPNISVDFSSVDFGSVTIGFSADRSVAISNNGTAPLSLSQVSVSGPAAEDFVITHNCSLLAAGEPCSVAISFRPSAEGVRTASLDILSNDPDSPALSLPLFGRGLVTPTVKMPVPPAEGFYPYEPLASSVLDVDPAAAKPFAIGNVGMGVLSLSVGLLSFHGPVDVYLGIYAPSVDPETVWVIYPGLDLHPVSEGLVAWRTGTEGPIDEALYGNIPLNALPQGTYFLYLAVTPANSISRYYLWTTYFVVP